MAPNMSKTFSAAGLLIAAMLAIGTADFMLTEIKLPPSDTVLDGVQADTGTNQNQAGQAGVIKSSGPDVRAVLTASKFNFSEADEESLISLVIRDGTKVESLALSKDSDRAGFMAWAQSPRVKVYFMALKEALHTSFTPLVRELIDETQRTPGKPVINLLSFMDEGISSERLVFIRVRERLFEFHVPEGKDDMMFELIEKLTE